MYPRRLTDQQKKLKYDLDQLINYYFTSIISTGFYPSCLKLNTELTLTEIKQVISEFDYKIDLYKNTINGHEVEPFEIYYIQSLSELNLYIQNSVLLHVNERKELQIKIAFCLNEVLTDLRQKYVSSLVT